ncbi:VWA domain-containing protein [Agrobacterium vitis]|uniref:VWA domain-containing protein n=1 Tax=Rhizobium/Agrobacterium group TaxID=227290 RepID=UPI00115FB495|nr:pilus assembly protein TadG-related protein [Agrobacterium vitis]MCF1433866.1 VWA domain-containing protein [Allorhizobium ampelinum]MUO91028.1 VWA domain-containing protein [Agrobacterium vitis]MUZ55274.1 VWA domain-containing protein [Agrobacterium vitis]MUZ93744.1 VWA domain-containing protein [Agrobacterium vitis]MVA41486.1 VWA domain-containing protein [Agrobacterium vitis]
MCFRFVEEMTSAGSTSRMDMMVISALNPGLRACRLLATKARQAGALACRLLRHSGGNFGMMTAVLLPVSIGVAGLAMDATEMVQSRSALQSSVDAAALAAASAMSNGMSEADAIALAKSFLSSQLANTMARDENTSSVDQITQAEPDISVKTTQVNSSSTSYDVELTGSYTITMNPLSRVLGWETVTLKAYGKAQAATTASESPLSMYLVLDRSGSMNDETATTYTGTCTKTTTSGYGWNKKTTTTSYSCTKNYTKIESLKLAVADLAAQLKKADPNSEYVRTGADSYNASADTAQAMSWGTANVVTYVNALSATGGTDARGALSAAYSALQTSNKTEITAHNVSSVSKIGRYIVFMTDGEMTGNSSSWSSSIDSAVRSQCTSIKADGIQIYTVAFMAPANGKSLLSACASDASHYYEATDAASLVAAFGEIGKKATSTSTRLTN